MKLSTRLSSALLAVLMVFMLLPVAALTVGAADDLALETFSVMSYNVKNDTPSTAQYNLIKAHSADIVGLQEVTSLSAPSFKSNLSGYSEYRGTARGGDAIDQYNPIFYKTDKFTLKASGTFWLSETPNSASKFSDSNYNRIATYVLLQITGTSAPAQFVLAFNTHLDYDTHKYTSTAKQANVLMQKVAELEETLKGQYMNTGENVLGITIGGDFNVGPTHGVVKFMTGTGNASDGTATPLKNTYTGTRFATARSLTSNFIPNTYAVNGNAPVPHATVYNTDLNKYAFEFDHILATTKTVGCTQYEIVSDYHNADHMPVMASFQLKQDVASAKISLLNVDQDDTSFSFYKDGSSAAQATTSLNCAPTNDYTSKFKFMVDSTQTGNLKASVNKIEIFNGPQAPASYTPFDMPDLNPGAGASVPTLSASFTNSLSTTHANAALNAQGSASTGFAGWAWASPAGGAREFTNGAMKLSSTSGNTVNVSTNMVENSGLSTKRFGNGTSAGFTADVVLKMPNSISVPSTWTPTASTATYGGQIGLIIDVCSASSRGWTSTTYGMSSGTYPAEVYISIVRSERGSTNALIMNAYGQREGLGTYSNVSVEYQAVNIDFENYHRYTITYQQTASSNKRVFVYCDGVQIASFTDSMYRKTSGYQTERFDLALANRGYSTGDGQPATVYVDRISAWSGSSASSVLKPVDTSALAAKINEAKSKLNGNWEPATLAVLEGTLALTKTQFDDNYNDSGMPDPFNTSSNSTWVTQFTNALTTAINGLIPAQEEPVPELPPEGVLWYENFDGITALPSTLAINSTYPNSTGMTIKKGYWSYSLAKPASNYSGDVKTIVSSSAIGNYDGVTVNMYACFDELPTRPGTGGGLAPYRGVQVELYLNGVDKMVTVGLNAMTSAEKSANPGCDAWLSLFTVVRGGAVTHLPVNLGIGDGKVHKYTFVYDVNAVRDLSGNVFGIYTDANCTQLVDTINVSGSITASPDLPLYVQPKNSGSGLRTYYVKQIAAANGYFMAKDTLSYKMVATDDGQTIFLNNKSNNEQPIYAWKGAPTFTAYSGAFDGQTHPAITSVNNPNPTRVSIQYSMDGTSWGNTIPTISTSQVGVNITVYTKAIDGQGTYADTVSEFNIFITYVLSVKLEGGSGSVTVKKGNTTLGTFTSADQSFVAGVEYGDVITLTAAASNFLCWKNARNGRALSTESVLTYPAGTQMDLVAVYAESAASNKASVVFKDSITGKIYKVMEVTTGTALKTSDFPATTALFGYTFINWQTESEEDATGAVISGDTTILANYTRAQHTWHWLHVVDGGTTTDYGKQFGVTVAVTAKGANFSYWTLNNGKILSTKPTVLIGISDADVTLTAVYGASDTPTAPILSVLSGSVNSDNAFAAVFTRSMPSNITFVESGILLTRKADPSELYVGTAELSVTKGVSTALESDDCYGFQKDMTGKEGRWYFRTYLIYKDTSGTLSYAYSDTYVLLVTANTAATATLYKAA